LLNFWIGGVDGINLRAIWCHLVCANSECIEVCCQDVETFCSLNVWGYENNRLCWGISHNQCLRRRSFVLEQQDLSS